jgi:anti-anti-sigma factor
MRYIEKDGVYIYPITRSLLFDETTVFTMFRAIDELLTNNESRNLAIDLTQVEMAGTPAVRLLLRLKARCKQLNREFGLCGLQPTFRDVLHIMNLDQFFQIYEHAEQAVAALGNKQKSVA